MLSKGIIYILLDPRDGLIKYVGQTRGNIKNRLRTHLYNANYYQRNNKKDNWLRYLISNNTQPIIEIIEEFDLIDNDSLDFWEMFYINLFLSWNINLKNGTLGGKSGRKLVKHKKTEEAIRKQRESILESYKNGKIINANKGRKMSSEQKNKLKQNSSFNKPLSEQIIKKRAESNIGKKRNKKQKENIRKSSVLLQIKRGTYKVIVCIKDNEKYYFNSLSEASEKTKIARYKIYKELKGEIKNDGILFCYGTKEETIQAINKLLC